MIERENQAIEARKRAEQKRLMKEASLKTRSLNPSPRPLSDIISEVETLAVKYAQNFIKENAAIAAKVADEESQPMPNMPRKGNFSLFSISLLSSVLASSGLGSSSLESSSLSPRGENFGNNYTNNKQKNKNYCYGNFGFNETRNYKEFEVPRNKMMNKNKNQEQKGDGEIFNAPTSKSSRQYSSSMSFGKHQTNSNNTQMVYPKLFFLYLI